MYPTSKQHFHVHCDVISDAYMITNIINSMFKFNHSINTGIRVKNTEVHAETLNDIAAIKLSNTDNVVVVGADVDLLILLSILSHHNNA